ncbi:CHASE2 domain-containing protein [Bacteriovorax sp. PP10]|uniref:histidine kinase n=1 Tax=Bacteriovorax antarcticus TaxID=3088717 RepID=A0ABU5VPK6_9BACT|nr:CHASE2 domain-containing protein [Bacteriovorax sp. PP10]MEA9354867.1 CHASE2 domain-containing protein [Bacteriovorax sp. PP10]
MKFKKLKIDLSDYYPLLFTLIFVTILFQYPLASFESIIYDLKVRWDFGIKPSPEIVIVTLDEESDDYLGDVYPYTYATHSRFLEKILKSEPKIIDYFVKMPEVLDDEDVYFSEFKSKLKNFMTEGGKVNFGTEIDEVKGEELPPLPLREFNYNLAQLNVDNFIFAKDDVVRRAIFNVSGEESLHLLTANQYRAMKGKNVLNVPDVIGAYYNDEADANFVLFRYSGSPVYSEFKYKTIPFHRVLVGNYNPEIFKDKIVLIGPNYISRSDNFYLTPFNLEEYKAPKLIVHASIIDAFIQNKTIKMLPRAVSNIMAFIVAIILSILISKLKPKDGLIITLLVLASILLISYLLFVFMGLWLYTAHLVVTVFVVYYIWIPFRAIGEYQRRYAIQEETKLLKQVEKLKQNFLSLMSHDLKTPVAKIAGVADNLYTQNSGNPDIREKSQLIIDSTKELNKFISSILDLTKIESSNFGLNKISKDINSIIENVIKDLNFSANQKQVQIKKELAPLYPIEIDVTLITRVISNLVENAIKYSGPTSVVQVNTWDDEKWVYIEIKDNGVGIPAEELSNIFEKFYRIKNDANHSIKGTGLGLYLVKYFVELHGGVISVDSIAGIETKFLVKLVNK